jgi:hypothetical protein
MIVDNELEAWRDEWESQPVEIPDLAARVKRHSRFMRFMLAAEMLITAIIGGGTIWLAVNNWELDFAVLAGATWLFFAATWGFAVWNRRGSWSPVARTSSAYLEISIRRCRGAIRAVIFGMALFAAEMLFCLAWIYKRTGGPSFLSTSRMMVVVVASVLFLVWSLRYRATKKAELAGLMKIGESTS